MIPNALATADLMKGRTRRAELQRLLGERGEVLPRVAHGSSEFPAQGWYARLLDGVVVFLGDFVAIAGARICRLIEEEDPGA